jgi:hypothetical protein
MKSGGAQLRRNAGATCRQRVVKTLPQQSHPRQEIVAKV